MTTYEYLSQGVRRKRKLGDCKINSFVRYKGTDYLVQPSNSAYPARKARLIPVYGSYNIEIVDYDEIVENYMEGD